MGNICQQSSLAINGIVGTASTASIVGTGSVVGADSTFCTSSAVVTANTFVTASTLLINMISAKVFSTVAQQ